MEACLVFLLVFALWGSTYAQDFYLAAPSTLRLNNDVTVAVAIDGNSGAEVDVYIQDYPGRGKNISQVAVQVRPGLPEIFKIRLDANRFPEGFLTAPGSPKLVSLNACFLDNHKEIVIPISSQSGYMFIQTDRSIYRPKQTAFFSMISLTDEALPSKDPFQFQIRNPDNIIVEENTFNGENRTLAGHVYKFPTHPVLGEWSAIVRFGHNLEQNSTVRFQLEDYVSSTFSVKLKTPDVILPDADTIRVEVIVRYMYGKRVKGTVSFLLGVKSEHSARPVYFAGFSPRELYKGEYTLNINLDDLKKHKDIGWFPGLDKSRLVVEATVVDYATGNKERAIDFKAMFSNSPFLISFKRCLRDFKPGLTSIFEADITHVDGRPAEGVATRLTAVADNGQQLQLGKNTTRSDGNGRVAFEIQPELHHKTVRLTLETNDPMYGNNQANSTFEQHAFVSSSRAYIAISRSSHLRLKPGDTYASAFHFEPAGLQNIYNLVVARGKILKMEKLPAEPPDQRMEIQITHDMVPDFRVVVFAHHGNELLADSLKIEVETECNPLAEVTIDPEFKWKEPGSYGKIIIRGTKDTSVGLFGVDEAVYDLSKKDLLTKTKMFNKFASQDLGCGPGGGVNIDEVLGNAGIALGTNKYTPSGFHSCVEIKRRKRELARKTTVWTGDDDPFDPDLHFKEEMEEKTPVERDFKETWIFENIIVGLDGTAELNLSLPHSITTWVIHAVSVSPQHGICVTEPKKLVSFKQLFLQLSLPYSVVRNEQVEIQATIFNYGDRSFRAIVFMYGAEGLCCGTQPKEKRERKRLEVDAQSAASVSFPVIPLNTGHFNIKVVALSHVGSDIIEKQLYVVPEGIPKEIHIPIKLDPTNLQGRNQLDIETPLYSDFIYTTQNVQVTAVKLSAPEGFVPGTASCSISALGDIDGLVLETANNNNLDEFLPESVGTGEQNMMRLASTFYSMRYLKVTGKLMEYNEAKGNEFILRGYGNQLSFRKSDGSYSSYRTKGTSTWLTAFVMKVFCQATTLVRIDENVICSGVQWLIRNQEADGSYAEKHPTYHVDRMDEVQGSMLMTAFALLALEECECECDEEGLLLAKTRAVAYLETHLGNLTKSLPLSIVAYALALRDSDMKQVAYDKLQSMASYNADNNWMYWTTDNSAQDIETAGYGLLTHLLFNDTGKSKAIVNWLNTRQLQSSSFRSSLDIVVALQALTEYAIRLQLPPINLVSNFSLSNDRSFHKFLTFNKENAHLQEIKIDRIGGTLFITTTGQGMASLSIKLRYNVIQPDEDVCKFDVTVNVTDAGNESEIWNPEDLFMDQGDPFSSDQIPDHPEQPAGRRVRRQNQDDNSKVKLNIALCVRYLVNAEAGMSIMHVGIFSGFEPVVEDLNKLERDPLHLINTYEKSSRGVVFYLDKVPVEESYCFSFHVIRQYVVRNTQMSVIEVYDYYNPDVTCTKFYSPESNSPLILPTCEGGVCECAESGCPPQTPFTEILSLDPHKRREGLKTIFCENYDYVWKGPLDGQMLQRGGFLNISFRVEEVIIEGIEKAIDIEGETRTLLARDNCQTANFRQGVTYLVFGKDGQAYKNENGETWYQYLLDQTSVVYQWWASLKQAPNKSLQRYLNHVTRNLKEKGCEL